jgi:predicted XRE-type DNA-binding protein
MKRSKFTMQKFSNEESNEETYGPGSRFEDFLEEEGLLAEVEVAVIKRVLAYQFKQAMKQANLSKGEMAKRMRTRKESVERLIDPNSKTVTLNTIAKAATALGLHLKITLEKGEHHA